MGTNFRLLAVVATVSLMGLGVVAAANADATTNGNEAVSVSLSFVGNGADPSAPVRGDVVKASAFVTNTTNAPQFVNVFLVSNWDFGWDPVEGDDVDDNADQVKTKLKKLRPGQTWHWSRHFKVRKKTPLGMYHLTMLTISPGIIDPLVSEVGITIH